MNKNVEFNKKSVVNSLQNLRSAVETAMESTFEPVYKKQTSSTNTHDYVKWVMETDLSSNEKSLLMYMHMYGGGQTKKEMATTLAITVKNVTSSIESLMGRGIICRHPFEYRYIKTSELSKILF